jgi:bacillithiol biosynthesis deacetylase BshB1
MADLLVLAPHPDDAEIHCGATIAAHVRRGAQVVVVDATRGELGSRGSAAEREREAAAAAAALGLAGRDNLDLPDGRLRGDDPDQRDRIVAALRRHRAATVLCICGHARHPDHIALASLVRAAAKAAALHRLPVAGAALSAVRLWYAEAELPCPAPTLLVPAEEADWERKRTAIRCYASQLHGSAGPPTSIATPGFMGWIEARGRAWGHQAGAAYAEAFTGPEAARVADLRGV